MREFSALLLLVTGLAASAAPATTDPLRVLLVTGGHDFQTNQFLDLFRSEPGVRLTHVVHPEAQAWFKPERAGDYDVLVSYDMWQDISEEAKADLLALVRSGKGFLAMHHCLASRKEEAGRVVYLQLGHDRLAYENPAFRQIVHQAIRWVARAD